MLGTEAVGVLLTAVFGFKSCHWPVKMELTGWTESRLPADVQLGQFYPHAHTQHFLLYY